MEAMQVGSSLMSSGWAWAARGHWLPPCSTQPWPRPGPHLCLRKIKLCQLTQLPQVFLPLPQGSLFCFIFFYFFYSCREQWQFLVSMVYQRFPLPTDLFLWLKVWHGWKLEGKPQVNGLALTHHSSPTTDPYSYWIWLTAINQPNRRHLDIS